MEQQIIFGRNSIFEALNSSLNIDTIYVSETARGQAAKVLNLAKEKNIIIKTVSNEKLTSICEDKNHQGIVAVSAIKEYCSVDDILKQAKSKDEKPFLIIADEIEDPHNLGAIIRTAEICGAHGIIIPKRRSAPISGTVYKASAGAVSHMLISRVSNISSTIEVLKEKGVWIYGAESGGENYYEVDYAGAVALIIGSEGQGITRLVRKNCDFIISIPMVGQITSLNASVAGGVIMCEIMRQRQNIKAKN